MIPKGESGPSSEDGVVRRRGSSSSCICDGFSYFLPLSNGCTLRRVLGFSVVVELSWVDEASRRHPRKDFSHAVAAVLCVLLHLKNHPCRLLSMVLQFRTTRESYRYDKNKCWSIPISTINSSQLQETQKACRVDVDLGSCEKRRTDKIRPEFASSFICICKCLYVCEFHGSRTDV